MLNRWIRGIGVVWVVGILAAFLFVPSAFADRFLGMDANGDSDCEQGDFDMGRMYTAGEVGTVDSFHIFYDTAPDFSGYGCVFCVTDKSKVGTASWTYLGPTAWVTTPLWNSDQEGNPITVSPSFAAAYPNGLCWIVSGVDFTGTNPINTFPYAIGTFIYQVAAEGGIYFAFDTGAEGTGNAILTTGGSSLFFDQPGQTCTPPAGTETLSWGSVKQLFR